MTRRLEKLWPLWARPAQLPPEGVWRVWVLMGGRGAGKTRAGAEWVRSLVESGQARRIALVGPTLHDVREVMIEGVSGLKAVASEGMRPVYNATRRRLEWPNGAVAHVFSAEDPDSLRGPQFDAAWCDEIAAWTRDEKTWETLMFALRAGRQPRVMATTTPRPRKLVAGLVGMATALPPPARGRGDACEPMDGTEQVGVGQTGAQIPAAERVEGDPHLTSPAQPLVDVAPPPCRGRKVLGAGRVVLTRAATRENAANLAPGFLPAMEALYGGTLVGRQELEGELIEDPPGALFTRAMIDKSRATADEAGELERVVVAVDPPAGSGPDAAACGIIAAGIRKGVVYVLRDASARGLRPMEWAMRAVALARVVGAGVIAAEGNQGGEMVRQVLEMAGAKESCRVVLLHARESKHDRAQPLSGLYDAELVRHVGVLRELEDEMCAFGAEGAGRSPDRVDALVWAVRELRQKRVTPKIEDLWEGR